MLPILVVALTLLAAPSFGQDCCSANQCDSDLKSVLHRYGVIGEGRFTSLRVKLCTTDPVTIQLWRPVDSFAGEEWTLDWQTTIMATSGSQTDGFIEFPLSGPFDITTNHRLGLYTNSRNKFPVPCLFDEYDDNPVSRATVAGSYNVNQRYSFSADVWSRDFSANVKFCYDGVCLNGWSGGSVVVAGAQGAPGAQGAKGDKGDTGPPGPSCLLNPDTPTDRGCDNPESTFYTTMVTLQQQIVDLQNQVSTVNNMLTTGNITGGGGSNTNNEQVLAGECLDGYVYGSYGIGKCYIFANRTAQYPNGFNFGQYIGYCAEQSGGSLPARPLNELENRFLASNVYLPPGMTEVTYWIGGMFSTRRDQWLWYEPITSMINPMPGDPNNPEPDNRESWWEVGQPLTKTQVMEANQGNFCVGFKKTIDNFYKWVTAPCNTMHGIICERAKQCN